MGVYAYREGRPKLRWTPATRGSQTLLLTSASGRGQLTVQLNSWPSVGGGMAEARGPGNTRRHDTWILVLALLLPGLEKPLNLPVSSSPKWA